jgi:hypothetical protein
VFDAPGSCRIACRQAVTVLGCLCLKSITLGDQGNKVLDVYPNGLFGGIAGETAQRKRFFYVHKRLFLKLFVSPCGE